MATVVVIGGSSGIGLATASMLVKQGTYARVVIAARDSAKLQTAVKQLQQEQQQQQHDRAVVSSIVGETVDATEIESIRQFYSRVGNFQHLVLAASGGEGAGPFEKVSEESILRGMQFKLFPHFRCAQQALIGGYLAPFASPAATSSSSSSPSTSSSFLLSSSSSPSNLTVTFVTAASSRMALPGTSGLAAINGAIQCMIPTIAKELANRNSDAQTQSKSLPPIRVNAVSPGVIRTPWWNGKEQMLEASGGICPLKRVGQAEEVGHAILFLIENTFVTGVIIDVDGGAHLQ